MTLDFFKKQHGKVTVVKSPKTGKFFFTSEDGTRGTVQQDLFTEVNGKVSLATGVNPSELVVNILPANADGEAALCIALVQTGDNTLEL